MESNKDSMGIWLSGGSQASIFLTKTGVPVGAMVLQTKDGDST